MKRIMINKKKRMNDLIFDFDIGYGLYTDKDKEREEDGDIHEFG